MFCGIPGDPMVYGWVEFAGTKEGRDWKVLRTNVSDPHSIQPDIVGKVVAVESGDRVDVLIEELDGRSAVVIVSPPGDDTP